MNRQVFRLERGAGPKSGLLRVIATEQVDLGAGVGALGQLERIFIVR